MEEKKNNPWSVSPEKHFPRLWLILDDRHLLIQWESLNRIEASADFLEISFDCEYGHIQFRAPESLQQLFEELQLERVRLVDGRKLKTTVKFV